MIAPTLTASSSTSQDACKTSVTCTRRVLTKAPASSNVPDHVVPASLPPTTAPAWPASAVTPNALLYPPETLRTEFSVLTDFLETLDERSFFQAPAPSTIPRLMAPGPTFTRQPPASDISNGTSPPLSTPSASGSQEHTGFTPKMEEHEYHSLALIPGITTASHTSSPATPAKELLPLATMTERFLLTAADQSKGSRDERLNRVIRSKYDAGLLKPHNYVIGYARLQKWMDTQ